MASPSEKLAQALEALHELQTAGKYTIRSADLTRLYRERLVKNGFLKEVIQGWYIPSSPDEHPGESTAWYVSFWNFCVNYLNERFGDQWCLYPEQSLLLHAGNCTVPKQLLIKSPKGNNNVIQLPHDTSLLDMQSPLPDAEQLELKQNLRVYRLPAALVTCNPQFFIQHPTDARAALALITDASDLLALLLQEGKSVVAGRLAGAFRNIGKSAIADDIIHTMRTANYKIHEIDPFEKQLTLSFSQREQSPYVNRMRITWHEMRVPIIEHFTQKIKTPPPQRDQQQYLDDVEKIYVTDAYHSLSIEGYQVSPELIKRVREGNWDPDNHQTDGDQRNALAARGYWQAFQAVKQSIAKVLAAENPGTVARDDHGRWYRELFGPCITAGILDARDLAGYRRGQVYIRHSMHVPPNRDAIRDLMPAFFDLLAAEEHGFVRVVLGHFFFVYIHPYMDGNGRMGRFLMNVMFAAERFPWLVIPVEKRDEYMASLEQVSVNQDIMPFCKLLTELMSENL